MSKKIKVSYCFIDRNYLLEVYGKQLFDKCKYETRPFVYFEELGIAVAYPEVTNHKPMKYWDNFYFDNDKHYLSMSSFIYVPMNKVIIDNNWNAKPTNKAKLAEIESKIDEVTKIWILVLGVFKKSQKFKDSHKFIEKSKELASKKK